MPDTFGGVEAVHKTTYANNVDMALQDMRNDLEDSGTSMSLSGKETQAVELIGSSNANIDEPENAPTPHIPPKHLGIFVKPRRITWGRLIPSSTAIKAAVDYNSQYVQEGAMAVLRARKQLFVNALMGPRLIKNALEDDLPTAVNFDTTNQRIASNYDGSATYLTVKKFVRAISLLVKNEVDVEAEQISCLITHKENEALYKELQVTNKDYRNKAVFEDKRILEFMKVRLIQFEGLPVVSNERVIPMYTKTAMFYGDAMPLQKHLERSTDRQFAVQAFLEEWYGATRREDERVVQIMCA